MNTNIRQILEKYWNAETSLQEEGILKSYFSSDNVSDEHIEFIPLFSHFTQLKNMSSDIDISAILSSKSDTNQNIDIDDLLEKYWNAETSLDEEKTLSDYFQNANIYSAHKAYQPMFAHFRNTSNKTSNIDIKSLLDQNIDIDDLLEKYWNAETNLEEEKRLSTYFARDSVSEKHSNAKQLFQYYTDIKRNTSNTNIKDLILKQNANSDRHVTDSESSTSEAKVINFRKLAMGLAAIFVLGFAAITVMNTNIKTDTTYKGKFVHLDEEVEAREAYEITKEALAFLSKNMKYGSKTIAESVSKAETVKIFK